MNFFVHYISKRWLLELISKERIYAVMYIFKCLLDLKSVYDKSPCHPRHRRNKLRRHTKFAMRWFRFRNEITRWASTSPCAETHARPWRPNLHFANFECMQINRSFVIRRRQHPSTHARVTYRFCLWVEFKNTQVSSGAGGCGRSDIFCHDNTTNNSSYLCALTYIINLQWKSVFNPLKIVNDFQLKNFNLSGTCGNREPQARLYIYIYIYLQC